MVMTEDRPTDTSTSHELLPPTYGVLDFNAPATIGIVLYESQLTRGQLRKELTTMGEAIRADLAATEKSIHTDMTTMGEAIRADLATTEKSIRADLAASEKSIRGEMTATTLAIRADMALMEKSIRGDMALMGQSLREEMTKTSRNIITIVITLHSITVSAILAAAALF